MIEDDDDDNDSLGSALSDYNGIFYGMLWILSLISKRDI